MTQMNIINGQQVIEWLQNNEIARMLLAETYAIKCEQDDEDKGTYDEFFMETLDEVKSMEAFK